MSKDKRITVVEPDPASQPGGVEGRPSRAEAEAAVRTMIRWTGDDPDREGVVGTPDRVVRAYEDFYAGYSQDPAAILRKAFDSHDLTTLQLRRHHQARCDGLAVEHDRAATALTLETGALGTR